MTSLSVVFLERSLEFLCIQASSASAERLFGDLRSYKGARHQHVDNSVIEILLVIQSFVKAQMDKDTGHRAFLISPAQALQSLVQEINLFIREKKGQV